MRNLISLVALVLLQLGTVLAAEPLPVDIAPADSRLYYIGRFDQSDPAGPRFAWSHSMLKLRFRGTDLQLKLNEQKEAYYDVIVDGQPNRKITVEPGVSVCDIARGLPSADHQVSIVRRAEAFTGISQIQGLYLNEGGQLLETPRLSRRIEVIGDSITCGYGNEAENEKSKFKPSEENAYWTYGAVAAREVGAEYVCVAWSGKKMWPNNSIPEIYDRTIPMDANSTWDYSRSQPDAVVINLATNDFGGGVPDEAQWTAAYKAFVKRIRGNYPKAMIYMASGSMMSDGWPPEKKVLSTLKNYLQRIEDELRAEGETRIGQIHFEPQNREVDGIGADWHPSVKTQVKMGQKLAEALKKDLAWDAAAK